MNAGASPCICMNIYNIIDIIRPRKRPIFLSERCSEDAISVTTTTVARRVLRPILQAALGATPSPNKLSAAPLEAPSFTTTVARPVFRPIGWSHTRCNSSTRQSRNPSSTSDETAADNRRSCQFVISWTFKGNVELTPIALVTGLPDPGRVRAAVARGVVNHGQRTMATALARWSSPRGALQPHTAPVSSDQ